MSGALGSKDLPTSLALWRWGVLLERESGKREWSDSILLPLSKAQKEAEKKRVLGFEVRVMEDAKAVIAYRKRKAEEEAAARRQSQTWWRK